MADDGAPLKRTPLDALNRALGGKMVPFAGWDMPVNYPLGVLKEHLHTREAAGLFDVSHMGQMHVEGADAARAIEALVPGDIEGLAPGRTRYTMFTNEAGGILDDLMITRLDGRLFVVVNAACKDQDIAYLRRHLGARVKPLADRALVALQGPRAVAVLARHAPEASSMAFMSGRALQVAGMPCFVTRSGYTGEDGFEISVPGDGAERLARKLLDDPTVKPIGLGARDSLRLEAGLCLYGHDIDTTTTPVEAGLAWSISKRRRESGLYPGATVVAKQLKEGAARRRVGIRPDGRAPAREGTQIVDAAGKQCGAVTSGGFGPTVNGPIAMGYVAGASAVPGTAVGLVVRGQTLAGHVATLPFVAHRYARS